MVMCVMDLLLPHQKIESHQEFNPKFIQLGPVSNIPQVFGFPSSFLGLPYKKNIIHHNPTF
jgi:hypothetical protein